MKPLNKSFITKKLSFLFSLSALLLISSIASKPVFADATTLRFTASFSECQPTSIVIHLHWQDPSTGAGRLDVCDTNVAYTASVSAGAFTPPQRTGSVLVQSGRANVGGWVLGAPTDVPLTFTPGTALAMGTAVTGIASWTGLGVSGCGVGRATNSGNGIAQCVVGQFIPGNSISYNGPTINFTQAVQTAYSILTPLGLALAAFMIIKSGYGIMTSEGEPNKVKEAREDLTSAVIGAVFILLSVVILRVIISSILGGN